MNRARKGVGGLSSRLKRMQEHGALDKSSQAPDSRSAVVSTPLGWESASEFVWRRTVDIRPVCPDVLSPTPLLPDGARQSDMIFLDIETTGLSGGAGTIAFLVGIGRSTPAGFSVEQLFLRDYPGEPEFLSMLLDRFDSNAVFVSFNGKSFDTQILKNRFIMNGMEFHFARQLDLLHPARKLWGGMLESCRLSTIEERVLGISRELDIPGSIVPEIYFDFLRDGDPKPLAAVYAHHLEDIVSLARLLAHMNLLLANPSSAFADGFRLGRWFVETGFNGGVELLTSAWEAGDLRAGHYLAVYLRRRGESKRAAELWHDMYEKYQDRRAAFELAKYSEHVLRNYAVAEGYVTGLLADADENSPRLENRDRLSHRLKRIRRKAEIQETRGRSADG